MANPLADLLDERVAVARLKAGKAAAEARKASGSDRAQSEADQALADLDHYIQLRDRIDVPRTGPYNERSARSFFVDVATAENNVRARESLSRYRDEQRSTSGDFGGLVVPQYLVETLQNSGHSGSPLVDVLRRPLPSDGMTIDVPRVITAVDSEDQDGENTAVTPSDPATDSETLSVYSVFASMAVPFAAIDRASAGMDQLVAREAVVSLQALEEARVINGSGSNGQPTGIIGSGASTVTMSGTTAADLLDSIAEAAAKIDDARETPADIVAMAPRRLRWLLANAGTYSAAIQPVAGPGPVVAKVLGLDVVSTGGMPVTLGSSTNEDRIVVLRRSDVVVADTPIRVSTIRDASGLGGSLAARLQVDRFYAAGVLDTTGVQIIVGTGTRNPF